MKKILTENLTEAFEEETVYVVHSDSNENNIMQEFTNLADALEYAKDNIDEYTYIEEVLKNSESEEIYSTQVIWSYEAEDAEEMVACEWCGSLEYESNCRRELNLGLICDQCQSALYSRGERPVFEEAYDSDYAEGEDIFEQDFPEADFEPKYDLTEKENLDELFDLSVNASLDGGDNNDVSVLSSYDPKKDGKKLDELFDADINLSVDGGTGNNVSVLSPLGGLGEDLEEDEKVELKELFGFGKKKKSKNRYILGMFKDTSGRLFTSEVWEAICDIVRQHVPNYQKSKVKYFSKYVLNQIEFVTTEHTADLLKIDIEGFLEDLPYQRKYISGSRDHINSAGETNADIARSAKHLIELDCIERDVTESISEEVKLTEGEKVYAADHDQDRPSDLKYVIVADPFNYGDEWGKFFKANWEDILKRTYADELEDVVDYYEDAYSLTRTNNLDDAEWYDTIEDATEAFHCFADYFYNSMFKEIDATTFRVGEEDMSVFIYRIKALRPHTTIYYELEESLKEETKLATNKKGDYLVAAESGKGYTVFSKDNVHLGGFDGDDDQKAIDRFNKGDFKESLTEDEKVYIPDYDQDQTVEGYVIASGSHPLSGRFFKQGWEEEVQREMKADEDNTLNKDWIYSQVTTDNLDDAELYESIEEAAEALQRAAEDYTYWNALFEKVNEKTFKVDWTATGDEFFEYKICAKRFRKSAWYELEESLDENGLESITVAEIKEILDKYGEISFSDEQEDSDEDGWRGANEIFFVDCGNGTYESYHDWIDQEGESLDSDTEESYDSFEELLYAIDGIYADIIDLDEYIGFQLAEDLEKIKDDTIVDQKDTLQESQAQEIGGEYNRLSREFGIDFEDLVYGKEGFMKTKYPEGFPDFAGDVIYSKKYWNELVEFAKEKGIDLK